MIEDRSERIGGYVHVTSACAGSRTAGAPLSRIKGTYKGGWTQRLSTHLYSYETNADNESEYNAACFLDTFSELPLRIKHSNHMRDIVQKLSWWLPRGFVLGNVLPAYQVLSSLSSVCSVIQDRISFIEAPGYLKYRGCANPGEIPIHGFRRPR